MSANAFPNVETIHGAASSMDVEVYANAVKDSNATIQNVLKSAM